MPPDIKNALIFGWTPAIAWALSYEIWALYKGYGYTLSEAIWWLDYQVTVSRKAQPMPPQVRVSLAIWGIGITYLGVMRMLGLDIFGCLAWLNHNPNPTVEFYAVGSEFALLGHFFWQRRSTYDQINQSLWREWENEKDEIE